MCQYCGIAGYFNGFAKAGASLVIEAGTYLVVQINGVSTESIKPNCYVDFSKSTSKTYSLPVGPVTVYWATGKG